MTEAEYVKNTVNYLKSALRRGDRKIVEDAADLHELCYLTMMEDYPPLEQWNPEITDDTEIDYFDVVLDSVTNALEEWIGAATYWCSSDDWICYIVGLAPDGETSWNRFEAAVEGTRNGEPDAYRRYPGSILVLEEYARLPRLPWENP